MDEIHNTINHYKWAKLIPTATYKPTHAKNHWNCFQICLLDQYRVNWLKFDYTWLNQILITPIRGQYVRGQLESSMAETHVTKSSCQNYSSLRSAQLMSISWFENTYRNHQLVFIKGILMTPFMTKWLAADYYVLFKVI